MILTGLSDQDDNVRKFIYILQKNAIFSRRFSLEKSRL